MHAGWPLTFSAQRRSATIVMYGLTSHATQAFPAQNGVL
jgi:hypothetical protein